MSKDLLGGKYNDSQKPVQKGDLVLVDNDPGQIEEVCSPGTELARNYSCEETGGLLIQFDDGILALLPYGHYHRITKRCQNADQEH
jgi:hypothetical protein